MDLRLTNAEIGTLLGVKPVEFPKYTTQLMNLANQNAQATRPRKVGQLSEMIKEFTGKTIDEWEQWYKRQRPDAIDTASKEVYEMVLKLRQAIGQVDEAMVKRWVEDLILAKTFTGLRFQEAILKKLSEFYGLDYRASTPRDESRGIDGYIGDIPISIKPDTYTAKNMLREGISARIVYYKKTRTGIRIRVPDELHQELQQK